MRTLADMAKDTRPEDNLILIELLASQVVSVAAYKGQQLNNLDEIRAAVMAVAGYPMLNRISGGIGRIQSNIGEEAAYRVAALIGLRVE